MAISSSNVIGGPSPAARNVIAANGLVNSNPGVFVVLGGSNNTIQNNYIGTDSSGTKDLGNGGSGIQLLSAASDSVATNGNTIIGNLIAGNGLPGIEIDGPKASANSVQSNKIGTQANGTSALPNSGDGVLIAGAANTSIGGTTASEANIIAFNIGNGVTVTGSAATGNKIEGNSIFGNTKLGIDLGNDGVTSNDFGQQDADTGPNNLQNVPVIVGASGNSVRLNYSSNISATFRIEIFANDVADPSNSGEGQTFLGAGNVTTNASGNTGTVTITLPASVPGGKFISATATDAAGNTSEFSANFTSAAPPVKTNTTTTVTSSKNPSLVGDSVTFTATVVPASGTAKPTGTVTFKDGAMTLGTGALNAQGVATFATAALSVGTHQITATYGGDNNFNASTGQVLAQVVNASDACSTVVTNINDSGTGSLRAAVDCANAKPDASTITFAASVRGIIKLTTIGDADATNGNLGDSALVLTAPVTITGPGANLLTAQRSAATGTASFRIFRVAKGVTATISGLAMSNGNATAPKTFNRLGGGIYSDGKLTLASCTISGNVAGFETPLPSGHSVEPGSGGGIYNTATATLTMSDCTVSNNTNRGNGAGIDNLGTATLSRCSLSGNKSPIDIAGFATGGGGISNDGASSHLTMADCTLSGNVATFGGGIGNIGTATVTRCTLSGNSAGYGGGIENIGGITITDCTLSGNASTGPLLSNSVNGGGGINNFGTATLVNCTIAGNSAVAYGGAISNVGTLSLSSCTLSGNSSPNGGTIYSAEASNSKAPPRVTLSNTILNAGAQGANLVNKGSTITSKGYNLSSDNGGGFLTATGDKINTDPKLGALANNGGPTQTLALLAGSPALDMGNPNTTGLPANDQRGAGFPRVLNGRVDIGAVEGGVNAPSKINTTTTVTSSLNPSQFGQSVTFTATVAPASGTTKPTGTVTFKDGATTLGTGTLANGVATFATAALSAATHQITATYSGDTNFNASTSAALSQVVNAATSNGLHAILTTPDDSNLAVVFPDANNLPNPPQKLVSGLPVGARPHGASYFSADNALIADFGKSRVFVVKVSTATLLGTIDTSRAGYNGSGTIAVAPNLNTALAAGSGDNSNPEKKLYVIHGPFGASSTITTVTLPGAIFGEQTEAIVFNSAGRAFVSTTGGIAVLDAPYTSVAFTIPFANTNSGAIAISPDGNTLLATTSNDEAVRIFHAPFSATSTPQTLNFPGTFALDPIAITPDGTKALVGASRTAKAFAISAPFSSSSAVSAIPVPASEGNFGFEDIGISADSQLAIFAGGGIVTLNTPALFVRAPFGSSSQVFAVPIQSGTSNTGRGEGAVRFQPPNLVPGTKINTTTTLTSSKNPSMVGDNVTFTATVAPASGTTKPTGTVTFKDGATTLGTGTLANGVATFSTTTLAQGAHSITATYGGDTNFNASASAVLNQVVNVPTKITTTITLASSVNPSQVGQSVTFTATVAADSGTAKPTGTVTFKDGTTPIGMGTLTNGVATFTTSSLSAGTHPITATYGGSANFNVSASAALSQVVNAPSKINTTTTVTSSLNPSQFGQSVTFTAIVTPATLTPATVPRVTGTPTGTVTFKDGATTLGTGTLNAQGVATFTTSSLSVGTHPITAVYGGDANFNASAAAALNQVVSAANKINTTTTLTSSLNPSQVGQSVTFTARVTPAGGSTAPTGTVTFKDGATTLGTGTLNAGVATFATSTLSVGTHPITAVYGGDSSRNGSSSAALNQVVTGGAATFSFSVGNLVKVGPFSPSLYFRGARFVQNVTITNTGNVPANGPLQLVLDGLPSTVSLTNGSGTLPDGTPFINVPGTLAVGQSVTVRLEFSSNRDAPTFTPRVTDGTVNVL